MPLTIFSPLNKENIFVLTFHQTWGMMCTGQILELCLILPTGLFDFNF